MASEQDREGRESLRVPIVEERAEVATRTTETGRMTVRSRVVSDERVVEEAARRSDGEVERIARGHAVDEMPTVREDGDLLIIPVVEEEVVVTRRLILKEEIVVRRTVREETVRVPVVLRRTEVTVERD